MELQSVYLCTALVSCTLPKCFLLIKAGNPNKFPFYFFRTSALIYKLKGVGVYEHIVLD